MKNLLSCLTIVAMETNSHIHVLHPCKKESLDYRSLSNQGLSDWKSCIKAALPCSSAGCRFGLTLPSASSQTPMPLKELWLLGWRFLSKNLHCRKPFFSPPCITSRDEREEASCPVLRYPLLEIRSVMQFIVVPGSGIEIFPVWLMSCTPFSRVKWLSRCMEEAQEASLDFICIVS